MMAPRRVGAEKTPPAVASNRLFSDLFHGFGKIFTTIWCESSCYE